MLCQLVIKNKEYAEKLVKMLSDRGFRVEADYRSEKVNRKIAESEQMKIPFALIVGTKEEENGTVSVRQHTKGDIGIKSIQEIIDLFIELNIPGSEKSIITKSIIIKNTLTSLNCQGIFDFKCFC